MASKKPEAESPWAIVGRQQKALAMSLVIDANFRRQFPHLDPFDQAFRILDASREWSDKTWEDIGENAIQQSGKNAGKHYQRKPIKDELRAMVQGIYEGRAKAPLAPAGRRAS